MAEVWLSVDQAATRLGVSTRTMYRHIKQRACQTRLTDDGKRQVLVDDTPDSLAKMSERQVQLAGASIGTAHELAEAYKAEAERWRRVGFVAWCCTAALGLVIMAGGGYGLYRGTRAVAEAENKAQNAQKQAQMLQARLSTQEQRENALQARLETLSGKLAASEAQLDVLQARQEPPWWKRVLAAIPSTRPSK